VDKATCYGVDGPGIESPGRGGRLPARFHTAPEAPVASCTMRTIYFPGVKDPGRGVDHPLTSSAEAEERIELYLYSPYVP
jgi:hypothetical protein